jgi:signal transduction histidine kinase
VSDPHPNNPSKEREETNARLLAERAKTDDELVQKRASAEDDEDHIVKLARERAEETLGKARKRADAAIVAGGATPAARAEVRTERAASDRIVARERKLADERLRAERAEHQRALSALLRFEREATDDGLLVERSRADEVVATRDDFLAIVSHDLRGILGTIAMSASLLSDRAVGDGASETRSFTHRIQRGTARMNRLLGDLLDVVSLEAGKLGVSSLPHDAALLAREVTAEFSPSFAAKHVTLAADVPADPMVATLDHDRVVQVLANLLSNALKFTDAGGRVTVSLAATDSEVHFSVTDSGVGVPKGQLEAIFDRFGQVKRDPRGHGLGLYIARSIVDAHAGKIWAALPPEGGTALHFTLPRSALVAVEATPAGLS